MPHRGHLAEMGHAAGSARHQGLHLPAGFTHTHSVAGDSFIADKRRLQILSPGKAPALLLVDAISVLISEQCILMMGHARHSMGILMAADRCASITQHFFGFVMGKSHGSGFRQAHLVIDRQGLFSFLQQKEPIFFRLGHQFLNMSSLYSKILISTKVWINCKC